MSMMFDHCENVAYELAVKPYNDYCFTGDFLTEMINVYVRLHKKYEDQRLLRANMEWAYNFTSMLNSGGAYLKLAEIQIDKLNIEEATKYFRKAILTDKHNQRRTLTIQAMINDVIIFHGDNRDSIVSAIIDAHVANEETQKEMEIDIKTLDKFIYCLSASLRSFVSLTSEDVNCTQLINRYR